MPDPAAGEISQDFRNDEEDVDADESAVKPSNRQVIEDHQENSDCAETLDIGPKPESRRRSRRSHLHLSARGILYNLRVCVNRN